MLRHGTGLNSRSSEESIASAQIDRRKGKSSDNGLPQLVELVQRQQGESSDSSIEGFGEKNEPHRR